MKKTFLSLLLMAGSCAVYAQSTGDTTNRNTPPVTTNGTTNTSGNVNTNSSTNNGMGTVNNTNWNNSSATNKGGGITNNTMSATGMYNAYGATTVNAPANIQNYMMRDYPAAADVTWTQQGDFYHGTYLNNGRYNHVYYNEAGNTYTMALPVTQTWVPDEVVNKATSMFGASVYDITMIKGADKQNVYHVRLLEGGQVRSQFYGEDGAAINDPFVTDRNMSTDGNINNSAGTNMNSTNASTGTTTEEGSSTNGTPATGSDMNATTTNEAQQNSTDPAKVKIKSEGNKTKIVTKTEDGKKQKVKMKDGKVVEKNDQ